PQGQRGARHGGTDHRQTPQRPDRYGVLRVSCRTGALRVTGHAIQLEAGIMQPRHAHPSLDSIAQQLRSTQGEASREIILADPLSDTPIRVSLEQLRPYEHNPRILRNPLHDQLKASIRERGLDQPPTVTRRPGETHYIIRNGGNTRLAILNELWTETADERFFYLDCLFKPWTDESSALLGHLAENDLHAQL